MRRGVLAAIVMGAAAGAAFVAGRRRIHERGGPEGAVRSFAGESIHYIDKGAGPAVVLIHGFGGSTFSWRFVIDDLVRDHRVIALDLPGFGYSDRGAGLVLSHHRHAERVVALLDELGIERFVIAGHSMGGGIAQRVSAMYPERVERLVLIASVNAGERAEWRSRRGRRRGTMLVAVNVAMRVHPLVRGVSGRALRSMVFDPAYVTPEVVRGYCEPLLVPGTGACLGRMTRDTEDEELVDLSRIMAPTLVISGEADRTVPPQTGEQLAASIPGARHIVIPACGHLVAEEVPDEFLGHLRAFLPASAGVPS
jgi:pimeloyl-ACP methyl ester carboxylesterase